MSLYKELFNENKHTDELLSMINFKREDFKRFRDIFSTPDGRYIIVYTRCGGPNRRNYRLMYKKMRNNIDYFEDHDDEFDDTYSYITFLVHNKYRKKAIELSEGKKPKTIKELFDDIIERMEHNDPEAIAASARIFAKISSGMADNPEGGVIGI